MAERGQSVESNTIKWKTQKYVNHYKGVWFQYFDKYLFVL